MHASDYRRGTAIVVGLPWLRTGTGKVMEAQIRYLRSKGLRTVFVAVPHNTQQPRPNEVWTQFAALSSELGADRALVATFDGRIRKGGQIGRWYGARRGLNAMHWAMRAAGVSPIPPELDLELQSGNVETLLVNHVYAIQFGLRVKERLRDLGQRVPMIIVTHDVQAHILMDNNIKNPFTRKLDTFDQLVATEITALANADVLVHVSEEDRRFFETEIPSRPHVLALPTADDLSGAEHPFSPEAQRDLLFVGSNHIGNYQALEWFFGRVKPWFGASPLSFVIVGNVAELVQIRDHQFYRKIEHHLFGSAAETLPYYLMTRCVIIPMVSGRGVSVKTVEATAIGRPIVGTRYAYRGLPMSEVRASGLRICDDPRDFALETMSTLESPNGAMEASRKLYKSLFSYERFEKAMNDALSASSSEDALSVRGAKSPLAAE